MLLHIIVCYSVVDLYSSLQSLRIIIDFLLRNLLWSRNADLRSNHPPPPCNSQLSLLKPAVGSYPSQFNHNITTYIIKIHFILTSHLCQNNLTSLCSRTEVEIEYLVFLSLLNVWCRLVSFAVGWNSHTRKLLVMQILSFPVICLLLGSNIRFSTLIKHPQTLTFPVANKPSFPAHRIISNCIYTLRSL
jgi:hypothetical protein